jgi:hypothetical protein
VVLVQAAAPAAAFKSDREKWDAPLLLAADCGWTTATRQLSTHAVRRTTHRLLNRDLHRKLLRSLSRSRVGTIPISRTFESTALPSC